MKLTSNLHTAKEYFEGRPKPKLKPQQKGVINIDYEHSKSCFFLV